MAAKLSHSPASWLAVVVEADFPDAFRVNLYARGMSTDGTAEQALGNFERFPTWCVAGRGWQRVCSAPCMLWSAKLSRPARPLSGGSWAALPLSGAEAAALSWHRAWYRSRHRGSSCSVPA